MADYEKNQSGFRPLGQLKGHPGFLINILYDSGNLYINGPGYSLKGEKELNQFFEIYEWFLNVIK